MVVVVVAIGGVGVGGGDGGLAVVAVVEVVTVEVVGRVRRDGELVAVRLKYVFVVSTCIRLQARLW